jgi:hypothetical protein
MPCVLSAVVTCLCPFPDDYHSDWSIVLETLMVAELRAHEAESKVCVHQKTASWWYVVPFTPDGEMAGRAR